MTTAPISKPAGWLNLAGGMSRVSRNWREGREDQASILVNATVRSGFAEVRPSFEQFDVAWESNESRQIFSSGKIQGSRYFGFASGARFLYAVDGHLFSIDPVQRTGKILPVDGIGRGLARNADFVFFEERGNYMIAQDGQNPPVLIHSEGTARASNPAKRQMKIGTSMADGWGRLAVLSADRRRIYFSNHENDPTRDPLEFTEDDYYLNAAFFVIERSLGLGVSLAFMPYLDGQSGTGALVCFCERGTLFFDVSQPRDTWLTKDIRRKGLPHIGSSAHRSVVPVGMDLVFTDQSGRLQTVQSARREEEQMAFVPFDRAVWDVYANDDAWLRRWRVSLEWDNRLLTTVSPTLRRTLDGRTRVAHRGMMVLELDKGEPFADSDYPVWAGLWTGILPATLDKGLIAPDYQSSGEEICLALCVDPDGTNRLYEITRRQTGLDIAATPGGASGFKDVESIVASRWTDGGLPGSLKTMSDSRLSISAGRGRTKIVGTWQSDNLPPAPWFEDARVTPNTAKIDGCQLFSVPSAGQTIPLPKLPRAKEVCDPLTGRGPDSFRKARAIFNLSGPWRLEEWIGTFTQEADAIKTQVQCDNGQPIPPLTPSKFCEPKLFGYVAANAPLTRP